MSKPIFAFVSIALLSWTWAAEIPLPEHPRPDFARTDWINLNGAWSFAFDPTNVGEKSNWQTDRKEWEREILVPFSWGSPLSGVPNEADIGWYARKVTVPSAWKGRRVFLVVGASDWLTTAWLDGQKVGSHRGGYTPFEFELTKHVRFGEEQQLVLRVDDSPYRFKLEGKQGYGAARGIWQTPHLEARPETYIDSLHFTPDIDQEKVEVELTLDKAAVSDARMSLRFRTGNLPEVVQSVSAGQKTVKFAVSVPRPRLWSLSDPFLYEVTARLERDNAPADEIDTYFGMRKVSVVQLPGSGFPYIALNNQPVYLQLALDQSHHPDGYYTFPSDEFMRDEILRARRIGLNGLRLHVKIDIPRKLYWADRLGILLMADVPNSWGEPDTEMRFETETAVRGMIKRDYNHPSIFSWVIFNETWGLQTGEKKTFLPETQQWVDQMFRLVKSLDPSRLVEDNSPCNSDHVSTDINSWHQYLPGYQWRQHLDEVTSKTFPGSDWNFIGGRKQGSQPLLNSECGNVWGYQGSTGDVDWSWDYHLMINEFRRHPKICGWLYTEHHDVINEWNGYYRYDRSNKETGLSELVQGMSLRDFHSPHYVLADLPLCTESDPGAEVSVPLIASFMTGGKPGQQLVLKTELYGWDDLGRRRSYSQSSRSVEFKPWSVETLAPLSIKLPEQSGLFILTMVLEEPTGSVLHRNFTAFRVAGREVKSGEVRSADDGKLRVLSFSPAGFASAKWSQKQWNVMDGLKVNGAGAGYFEYTLPWPDGLDVGDVETVIFRAELSAKQLFGKDRPQGGKQEGDFMRGKGTHDPSLNPNAYPMTDEKTFPSAVRIRIGGESVGVFELPDDPADHRGILSWHSQKKDKRLREAGSYGYLISAVVPPEVCAEAAKQGRITIRLEVDEALAGGLAIYGADFGRYPLDPTLIFKMKGAGIPSAEWRESGDPTSCLDQALHVDVDYAIPWHNSSP